MCITHRVCPAGNWQAGLGQLCTATPNLQVLDLSANTLLAGKLGQPPRECLCAQLPLARIMLTVTPQCAGRESNNCVAACAGTLPDCWGQLHSLTELRLSKAALGGEKADHV